MSGLPQRKDFRHGENKEPGGNPRYEGIGRAEGLYLTSIFYHEEGLFNPEQLARRAEERLFNWDMYVLKLGDTRWRRPWVIPALAAILDNNYHLGAGDPGPGGGLVFYDKGDYAGGWRYLEAAPADWGMAPWGWSPGIQTGRELGDGLENTRRIVRAMERCGVTGTAAQVCASYAPGGLDDWFLPSREELRVLAGNLTFIKTGPWASATDARHWSSTGNGEDADAIFTWEKLDTYDPRMGRPTSSGGPWVGTGCAPSVGEVLPLRPVRRF